MSSKNSSQLFELEQSQEDKSHLADAVAFLNSKPLETQNIAAAAEKFKVSYHTLQHRFSHNKQKILTAPQEDVLLEWMCYQAEEGRPWGKERVRVKVEKLTSRKPSLEWVKAFYACHKDELKFCGTSGLDLKQAQAFNPATMSDHFKKLGDAIKEHKYKLRNIYNFDETGMQIGGGRRSTGKKYFISRRSRAKYKKWSAYLELVTMVECVCADGTKLDLGFIFQGGKTFDMDWFLDHPDIFVGLTENGWTDNFQCEKWFTNVFIPKACAKAGNEEDPILLIFDGHGSHLTDAIQPCDTGCFGPLQRAWIEQMEEIVEETHESMPKHEFVNEYMAVWAVAIKEVTIKAAFRKTGIALFNPNIFTNEDFAPSRVTSIKASLPSSFPEFTSSIINSPDKNAATPSATTSSDPFEASPILGPNGELLDASKITWYNDPNDNKPIPQLSSKSTWDPSASTSSNTAPSQSSTITHDVALFTTSTSAPQSASPKSPGSSQTTAVLNQWGPKLPEFKCTVIHLRLTLRQQIEILNRDLDRTQALYLTEFRCWQALEVHCDLTRHEIGALKHQLHSKKDKAEGWKGKQLQSAAEFLMSSKALECWRQQKAEREEKEAAEQAKQQAKEDAERGAAERRAWLITDTLVRFAGSLKRKKKEELQDIRTPLSIPINTTGQTNAQLIEKIIERLSEDSQMRVDPHFTRLAFALPTQSSTDQPVPDAETEIKEFRVIPNPRSLSPPPPSPSMTSTSPLQLLALNK
ncbi:hypothetical protein JAAARDRAFT_62513 [Jaapia argillacea MUCL 33604]|uniref:HTH CENPB-type domain-containing protein n=1 Tax=Jaapia argillacea MUCL 33604 TaxID=933084 RepID=A0A067P9N7_9AGAM|nr:hypothetical protein JAAARDRAFT_62513 [Jaapia argillacea MUCL 33604]